MDGSANYMSNNNNNEKIIVKNHHHQQQQWGFAKDETFCSDDHEFEWPAKNYCCNFCRREFKSAQALGGHMNVHRRDRARLRLLPSWVPAADHSSYPNPNFSNLSLPPPSLSLSSPAPSCFTFRSNHSSLSFNELEDDQEKKKPSSSSPTQDDHEILHVLKKKKKSNLVNLELKMGNNLGVAASNSNEDLDLELHL